jgi:hypothetical protein
MTCRRAWELDLPAFVIDPRDPAWADFRAHYPRCAECAAEVAVWSALQATLAERHPEPEELLRWHDAPAALPSDARAAVARHVERCLSCRDELRALDGFAAAAAANPAPARETPAAPAHHPFASRAGGRRAERHAFARDGSTRVPAQVRSHDGRRPTAGRGVAARVLLHPAFAYAVLALVLLLPTVRATLDRDAGRAAFDTAASRVAEQAPAAPQPITAAAPPLEKEAGGAPGEPARAELDDAHVDHVAPRLVRQAPFRPAPPPAPQAPAPPSAAAAPAAKALASGNEGRLARGDLAAEAPTAAGAALRDAASEDTAARARVLGGAGTGAAIRLLPGAAGAARTLVLALPPGATGGTDLEVRIADPSGGRELRQRVARAAGAGREVQVTLPAGFTAPVLRVEVYAGGAGPILQGQVTP